MPNSPLNKVVFIQRVAAFTKTNSLKGLFRLAYVNTSWNDTIKNYSSHLFEKRISGIESGETLEDVSGRVIKSGVVWFVDVLMFSKTILDRVNLPQLVLKSAPSDIIMMQIVFEKIAQARGNDGLNKLFTETDDLGMNCIMLMCLHSSSPEVVSLLFEKIIEVGGKEMLKSQLAATEKYSGSNCLMVGVVHGSPLAAINLIFEKIVELGGKDLLKSALTAPDDGGWTCLVGGCAHSTSPEIINILFEKIVEAGGTALLMSELSATSRVSCLRLACGNSASPEVAKLIAIALFELGLFKKQYSKLRDDEKVNLRINAGIKDESWTPDAASLGKLPFRTRKSCAIQ